MEVQSEVIVNERTDESTKTIKTPSYTLKAIRRYQEQNKDKINERRKQRYKERYENDPEFREKQKQLASLQRQKKKLEKERLEN